MVRRGWAAGWGGQLSAPPLPSSTVTALPPFERPQSRFNFAPHLRRSIFDFTAQMNHVLYIVL